MRLPGMKGCMMSFVTELVVMLFLLVMMVALVEMATTPTKVKLVGLECPAWEKME